MDRYICGFINVSCDRSSLRVTSRTRLIFCAIGLLFALRPACAEVGFSVAGPQKQILSTVHEQWRTGDRAGAIRKLEEFIVVAPPSETMAPKLRLAYMQKAQGQTTEALRHWSDLVSAPPGVADSVRGEAALRLAYAKTGWEREKLARRIIDGVYPVTKEQLGSAYRLAAAEVHRRGDLQEAIDLWSKSPFAKNGEAQRSFVLKELAATHFELAKGEGNDPLSTSSRSQAFAEARRLCTEVLNEPNAPVHHQMVAELMFFETHYFQRDYEDVYRLASQYLLKWGRNPLLYDNQGLRRYVNTAKAFLMQSAYILGLHEDAELLANEFVADPPSAGDEFPNSRAVLLALIVMKLTAYERGEQDVVAVFGERAGTLEPRFQPIERHLFAQRLQVLEGGQ